MTKSRHTSIESSCFPLSTCSVIRRAHHHLSSDKSDPLRSISQRHTQSLRLKSSSVWEVDVQLQAYAKQNALLLASMPQPAQSSQEQKDFQQDLNLTVTGDP
ncbi:hypothetical protein F2Q70_00015680 [Brassica cretica]|uniref:Uncharacterized protein n=1 Tax=Brassica cretica TaxID=69181 RepID=A0A8S9HXT5_BRACR|nr:hypothetical protein F2Q70_00015680 [Brassica cretica]